MIYMYTVFVLSFLACADLSLHGVPGVGDQSVCGVSSDVLSVLGLEGVLQLTLDVFRYLTVTKRKITDISSTSNNQLHSIFLFHRK